MHPILIEMKSRFFVFEVIFFGVFYGQFRGNLGKNPSHPQNFACFYTYPSEYISLLSTEPSLCASELRRYERHAYSSLRHPWFPVSAVNKTNVDFFVSTFSTDRLGSQIVCTAISLLQLRLSRRFFKPLNTEARWCSRKCDWTEQKQFCFQNLYECTTGLTFANRITGQTRICDYPEQRLAVMFHSLRNKTHPAILRYGISGISKILKKI